ncbi:siroheme synthase CysG [Sphingomonas daechungensis]|uniref:siroheme synthase CysG n=1 Tax=Sphingomonas daechungensis TaxID=1176646 RepID=UPI0031E5415F
MSDISRIAPLANLPLFHRLQGRKAVVIGSSEGAKWKAELLSAAGADVHISDHWEAPQLEGAAIAVADLADHDEALRLIDAAHAAGAVVNIIDQTDLCDVTFGTIVNRSPIVVGISTDGAAPVLGQSIRSRIESVLPLGLSSWAKAAKAWRPRLKQRLSNFSDRRAFWQRFAVKAWSGPDLAPLDSDFDALVASAPGTTGRVTLVGAGPGDPELLTLKAVRALQTATVILYDHLVGPDVLELARREARRVPVGKSGHGPSCKQSDINEIMVELARAGDTVVRLKGGDPMIFGRATEEIDACRAAGIEISAIPGISAAQGVSASLLMSLTERRHARRVQFLTGHGADGKLPSDIDWISVADRKVTTVLYMPRKTLGQFVRDALRKGIDPETPAIAIASATLPDEVHVSATVAEIENFVAELPIGAPVTVVIGWVGRRHVGATSAPLPFPKALAS